MKGMRPESFVRGRSPNPTMIRRDHMFSSHGRDSPNRAIRRPTIDGVGVLLARDVETPEQCSAQMRLKILRVLLPEQ